jgi:hypothetical protein
MIIKFLDIVMYSIFIIVLTATIFNINYKCAPCIPKIIKMYNRDNLQNIKKPLEPQNNDKIKYSNDDYYRIEHPIGSGSIGSKLSSHTSSIMPIKFTSNNKKQGQDLLNY